MMSVTLEIDGYSFDFTVGDGDYCGVILRPDNSELYNPEYLKALNVAFELLPILEDEHKVFHWSTDDLLEQIYHLNMDSIDRIEQSCRVLLNQEYFVYSEDKIAHINRILNIINGGEMRQIKQKPTQKPKPGYVYLLKAEKGYKIGMSKKPIDRISNLGVVLPFPIEPIVLIKTADMVTLERTLHQRYNEYRINGEWFDLNESHVEYIKGLAE